MSTPEWPSPLAKHKPRDKGFLRTARSVEDRWALWGVAASIAVAVVVSGVGAWSAHETTGRQVDAVREQIAADTANLERQIQSAERNLDQQLAEARESEAESDRRDSLRSAWATLLDLLLRRRESLDEQANAIYLAATRVGVVRAASLSDWNGLREEYGELEASTSVAKAVVRLSASQSAHLCISAYEDFLVSYYLDVLVMGNAVSALAAEDAAQADIESLSSTWRHLADDSEFGLVAFARSDIVLNGDDPGGSIECLVPDEARFPEPFNGFEGI